MQQESHSTLDANERDRWKQYLDDFVDSGNQVGNAMTLEGRAELVRRFMDDNRRMDDNRWSANATSKSVDAGRRGARQVETES